jgi:hypothetical protein
MAWRAMTLVMKGSGVRVPASAYVTPILLVVAPLVVVLLFLISRMNNAEHFAPQAYYRRKRGGAPLAFRFESLGPRARKPPHSADGRNPDG